MTDTEVAHKVAEQKAQFKVHKTKNVSIKKMTGTSSWRLENTQDVDRYIEALRKTLVAQLDEDTIVNVEF